MLHTLNRLKKQLDFKRVATKGRGFFIAGISCKIKDNNKDGNRFAIVISKKIHKHATKRNLIRRRLSEILRKRNKSLQQGFDVLIMVNSNLLEHTYKELDEMVGEIVKKSKIL